MKQNSPATRPTFAAVVDSLERARFFLRVAKAAQDFGSFIFLTSEPIAHLRIHAAGYHSVYLHRAQVLTRTAVEWLSEGFHESAIEVLNGDIPVARARTDTMATMEITAAVFRRFPISTCLVWNGQQLIGLAVSQVCRNLKIPVRFLELSNLPDKLFVDDLGVNARSSIANDPAQLDRLDLPTRAEHEAWLIEYECYKAQPVPQAANASLRQLSSRVNVALKTLTLGVARRKPIQALRRASIHTKAGRRMSGPELRASGYLFLPLQVSGDTQIKLNSDVDNLRAIQIAHKIALSEKLRLLVKMHPAEQNSSSFAEVAELSEHLEFDIVENSTTDLLKGAQKIVTINSTVGLEGLLYGKPVVCLGRALYAAFDETRLLKYIHRYLVADIDYFGKAPITKLAISRLLGLPAQ